MKVSDFATGTPNVVKPRRNPQWATFWNKIYELGSCASRVWPKTKYAAWATGRAVWQVGRQPDNSVSLAHVVKTRAAKSSDNYLVWPGDRLAVIDVDDPDDLPTVDDEIPWECVFAVVRAAGGYPHIYVILPEGTAPRINNVQTKGAKAESKTPLGNPDIRGYRGYVIAPESWVVENDEFDEHGNLVKKGRYPEPLGAWYELCYVNPDAKEFPSELVYLLRKTGIRPQQPQQPQLSSQPASSTPSAWPTTPAATTPDPASTDVGGGEDRLGVAGSVRLPEPREGLAVYSGPVTFKVTADEDGKRMAMRDLALKLSSELYMSAASCRGFCYWVGMNHLDGNPDSIVVKQVDGGVDDGIANVLHSVAKSKEPCSRAVFIPPQMNKVDELDMRKDVLEARLLYNTAGAEYFGNGLPGGVKSAMLEGWEVFADLDELLVRLSVATVPAPVPYKLVRQVRLVPSGRYSPREPTDDERRQLDEIRKQLRLIDEMKSKGRSSRELRAVWKLDADELKAKADRLNGVLYEEGKELMKRVTKTVKLEYDVVDADVVSEEFLGLGFRYTHKGKGATTNRELTAQTYKSQLQVVTKRYSGQIIRPVFLDNLKYFPSDWREQAELAGNQPLERMSELFGMGDDVPEGCFQKNRRWGRWFTAMAIEQLYFRIQHPGCYAPRWPVFIGPANLLKTGWGMAIWPTKEMAQHFFALIEHFDPFTFFDDLTLMRTLRHAHFLCFDELPMLDFKQSKSFLSLVTATYDQTRVMYKDTGGVPRLRDWNGSIAGETNTRLPDAGFGSLRRYFTMRPVGMFPGNVVRSGDALWEAMRGSECLALALWYRARLFLEHPNGRPTLNFEYKPVDEEGRLLKIPRREDGTADYGARMKHVPFLLSKSDPVWTRERDARNAPSSALIDFIDMLAPVGDLLDQAERVGPVDMRFKSPARVITWDKVEACAKKCCPGVTKQQVVDFCLMRGWAKERPTTGDRTTVFHKPVAPAQEGADDEDVPC